jgi:hypothetical protein
VQRAQGRVGGAMEGEDQGTSLILGYHENRLYGIESK